MSGLVQAAEAAQREVRARESAAMDLGGIYLADDRAEAERYVRYIGGSVILEVESGHLVCAS